MRISLDHPENCEYCGESVKDFTYEKLSRHMKKCVKEYFSTLKSVKVVFDT